MTLFILPYWDCCHKEMHLSRNHAVEISVGDGNPATKHFFEAFLSRICAHQTVRKFDSNAVGF